MYQNCDILCAHVLVARFIRTLCVSSGSVLRIACSSFGWWLVVGLCALGPGPSPLRILVYSI